MTIVRKCMTIMSIIITEEDLCKKHAKKCAKFCQFSSLPSKCFQSGKDSNPKNDSKPHICAYNYNTRTGFRDHKKIWGSRVLSSALIHTISFGSVFFLSLSKNCFAYHFQLTPHRRLKLRSDTVSCYLAVSRKSSAQHFTNYLQHFQSKT